MKSISTLYYCHLYLNLSEPSRSSSFHFSRKFQEKYYQVRTETKQEKYSKNMEYFFKASNDNRLVSFKVNSVALDLMICSNS